MTTDDSPSPADLARRPLQKRRPVRESLGASLLIAGDAAGAEAAFREGLRRSPKNGRMLFGLLESLKAQGKTDAAQWVESEFKSAWKGADLPLRLKDM